MLRMVLFNLQVFYLSLGSILRLVMAQNKSHKTKLVLRLKGEEIFLITLIDIVILFYFNNDYYILIKNIYY